MCDKSDSSDEEHQERKRIAAEAAAREKEAAAVVAAAAAAAAAAHMKPISAPVLVSSGSDSAAVVSPPPSNPRGSGGPRRLSASFSAAAAMQAGLIGVPQVVPLLSPKGSGMPVGSSMVENNTVDLVYFFSCPLVVAPAGTTAEPIPLKLLDIPGEISLLKETFDSADRQVKVKFDWGCVENLRTSVTTRCRAIHYSGHGFPSGLAFEDKVGAAHMFEANVLRNLVAAGDQASIEFVFVSACHSEEAGKAFVDAGVPHVVAVRWDTPISDRASQVFSKQFYLSLLIGDTVRQAFDVGVQMVLADPAIRSEDEHKKFLLLPEDADHNVPIFFGINPGSWQNFSGSRPLTNMRANPEKFYGRQTEAQKLFKMLFESRVITLFGERGIGKSSLAKFVGNYALDRNRFDGIFWIPLGKAFNRIEGYKSLAEIFSSEVGELTDGKIYSTNHEFAMELARGKSKEKSLLLIIDGVDKAAMQPKDSPFYLHAFLSDILERHQKLTVLLTSRKPFRKIQDVHAKSVEVSPLSAQDSALLFMSLTRTLTNDEIGGSEGKPEQRLAKHESILEMKGNPGLIVEAAEYFSVTKNVTLASLKEEIPRLKESMEKEDAEEMPEPHSHTPFTSPAEQKDDDDDGFVVKKTKKVVDDDDWTPKKQVVNRNSVGPKEQANSGQADLFRQHGISQSGQAFWKFGDDVSCNSFFGKLNKEFLKRTGTTDRPLTKQDFEFFKGLLNKRYKNGSEEVVKISAFGGFWNWFEQFSEIIAEIPELWSAMDPPVVYLCTTAEANEYLQGYRPGTFLVRFSESRIGYLSLALKKKTAFEHLLVYKDDNGWNHDGDSVDISYGSVAELLKDWRAGKYVGTRRKEDVLSSLGNNPGGEESEEGPD